MNMMKMQLYVFTQLIDLIEADQVIDNKSKVLFHQMIFFLGSRRPGDWREVKRKKEE